MEILNLKSLMERYGTCVRVLRSKKCSFFGKFDVLRFLETPVLRFAILPYYRRYVQVWNPWNYWVVWALKYLYSRSLSTATSKPLDPNIYLKGNVSAIALYPLWLITMLEIWSLLENVLDRWLKGVGVTYR